MSKHIINNMKDNSTIILEDLCEIRKTVKYRKKSKHGRELNSWGFDKFGIFLEYKWKDEDCLYRSNIYITMMKWMWIHIQKKVMA